MPPLSTAAFFELSACCKGSDKTIKITLELTSSRLKSVSEVSGMYYVYWRLKANVIDCVDVASWSFTWTSNHFALFDIRVYGIATRLYHVETRLL